MHAIHTSIDGLEFFEFMSINAHECPSSLVSPSQPKISFTILAADRIFKVVMNMVVKSSPHQKHGSSVSLLVLKHDDLCQ